MSILIKGMEMPKDRPQLLWVYPNGKALIVQSDVDPWKDLQAVPIPTPHGRLIDANELHSALRKRAKEFSDSEYGEGVKCGLADAREYIKIAPTIIPAEEGE